MTPALSDYIDLDARVPDYWCSRCDAPLSEAEAFGIDKPNDTCPECGTVMGYARAHSEHDATPGQLSAGGTRTVRL